MRKTIVIGIGNPDRGDDGAGIQVARSLVGMHPPSIEILEKSGEGAELMECWRGVERVILVDAVQAAGKPGAIHRLDPHADLFPSDFFHYSSHAFSVAEAIEISRVLGELPPAMLVYGIEGFDFQPGLSLSPAVAAAVELVAEEIRSLLPACEIPPE